MAPLLLPILLLLLPLLLIINILLLFLSLAAAKAAAAAAAGVGIEAGLWRDTLVGGDGVAGADDADADAAVVTVSALRRKENGVGVVDNWGGADDGASFFTDF